MKHISQIWTIICSLLLGIHLLFAYGEDLDQSFLLNQLLKSDAFTDNQYSLSNLQIRGDIVLPHLAPLTFAESDHRRFDVLRNFPLDQVIAAPGHRIVRNPGQISGLVSYIKRTSGGDFRHDKILINVVTDSIGNIRSVDLWNAHHRMIAYLESGFVTLGEIKPENVQILVNGFLPNGKKWLHHVSIAGVNPTYLNNLTVIKSGGDTRPGTIGVSGTLSNYTLGSRNTIGKLRQTVMNHKGPRIGVFFGTFDPIHEGHIAIARAAIKEASLDEVVFVPNHHSINKPDATPASFRLDMIGIRIHDETGLNLYTGDSSAIIDRFGRNPFIERIAQTYGSTDIFQIIGEDSYRRLLNENEIKPDTNRTYLVFPRNSNDVNSIPIPKALKNKVTVVHFKSEENSSTIVRAEVRSGRIPSPQRLHPRVYDFIHRRGLYVR